jgi:hypothetical protein
MEDGEMRAGFGSGEKPFAWGLFFVLLLFYALVLNPSVWRVRAAGTNVQPRPVGVVTDTPSITIGSATATTTPTPTTSAREALIHTISTSNVEL